MKEPMTTIGKYTQEIILANPELTNTQILDKVKEKFPECKTSMACVAWYKSDLRKKNLLSKKGVSIEDQIIELEMRILVLKMKLEEEVSNAEVEELTSQDEVETVFAE